MAVVTTCLLELLDVAEKEILELRVDEGVLVRDRRQRGVGDDVVVRGVLVHADVVEGALHPLRLTRSCCVHLEERGAVRHGVKHDLVVNALRDALREVGLDGHVRLRRVAVPSPHTPSPRPLRHLVLARQNHRHAVLVELRASRASDLHVSRRALSHHLLQHGVADLFVPSSPAAPHDRSLDDHQIHGQVHTERERRRRAHDLDVPVLEQRLHDASVDGRYA